MAAAAEEKGGAMSSIIGLGSEAVDEALREAGSDGIVCAERLIAISEAITGPSDRNRTRVSLFRIGARGPSREGGATP